MFLKGLEIREYYPKTLMRQMTDNDILYDQSKRDVLLKVMKKNGYYLGTAIGASDDFFKEPYCTFEFHRTLFSENDAFNKDYDPWVNASKKEDTCRYILSREDNYIYTLCHMYKHYIHGSGCGVRFLCDLYLLAHSDDVLDFDFINSKLDEFGVLEFSNTALGLAEALFDARDPDEKQQELLDVMFLGGVFGRGTDKVKKELEKHNGSKFKYILRRIFPPKKMMVGNYKSLEKRPYLLPFYYIYRLFEKMHHNGGILKDELKRLSSIKNDK